MSVTGRRSRGFTLVEIIIVVAIVALFAAVAVPNYMRHRDDALEAATLENARIIAQAVNVHNATTAPPVTQDALQGVHTAEALGSLLGDNTPVLERDADVAAAVLKVAITGEHASVVTE